MKRSIKARDLLAGSFFLLSILPLILFGAAFWPTLQGHLAEDIYSAARSNLAAAAMQVKISAFERPKSVLPSLLMLADPGRAAASIGDDGIPLPRLLSAFSVPRPEYSALFVLDEGGKILASHARRGVGGDFAPGSRYALLADPVPGDVAFSRPFLFGNRLVVEASFSNPRRAVVALLDLDVISSSLVLATRSPRDRAGILDEFGCFVACSDPSRVMDRTPIGLYPSSGGRLTKITDQGTAYYPASMPIGDSAWQAVYLSSLEEADAPLRVFLWRLVAVGATSLALAIAIALALRRNLSEPLNHLASRLGMIAAGRYDERVGASPLAEFDGIGVAFNAMADSIQRRDREIQRSEERYRLLFLANRVPSLLVQAEGELVRDANDAAAAYYGYGREELRGMGLGALEPPGGGGLRAGLAAAARGGDGYHSRHRLRSGAMRDVEVYAGPISIDEAPHFLLVVFDVTRRRVAEERMASALEEKTLLLKEVYHRVKNNLQIISSLLNMQASAAGDGEVAMALRDGQDRVYAMALVHELVYQMEDLSSIDVAEYASKLALHAADAYSVQRDGLRLEVEELGLELERAIPFGLALNEILSNAFKYAAPSPVVVSLRLVCGEEGRASFARLSVEDEGPGMPSGVLEGPSSSLGISLIRGLAEQLHGEVSWGRGRGGKGTVVSFAFPVEEPDSDGGEAR